MKKVVSESEVAHLWANQVQDHARKSNRSFYFEWRTIYSYGDHFPIAVLDEKDNNICYFTTRTYSVTTTGHINTVRQAANHKTKIYCKNPEQASRGYHAENLADFEAKAKEQAGKLKNARKPELYLSAIAQQRELLNTYANHFGLDLSKITVPLAFIYVESKDGGTQASEAERIANEKARIEREKQQAEYQKELLKKHKLDLAKWRKGILKGRFYNRTQLDYLRFNSFTNRIETTQNVEIPLRTAKAFYKQILNTIKTGECNVCGSNFMEHYEIKEINSKQIVVGCHTIEIKEIKSLAKKLNWDAPTRMAA